MFRLNDIQISEYASLAQHFKYKEVREIIRDPLQRMGLIEVIGNSPREADLIKAIINHCQQETQPIEYGNEDGYESIFFQLFTGKPNSWKINWEKLGQSVDKLGKVGYGGEDRWQAGIQDKVSSVVRHETILKDTQAHELLLFCTLFAYLHREPNDSDARQLREFLNIQPLLQKYTELISPTTEFECYQYVEGENLQLDLAVIYNSLEKPALVKGKGSPLQRILSANERILVLTANQRIVDFLPRICVISDHVVYQKDNRLLIEGMQNSIFEGPEQKAVYFASWSSHFGYLIADESGHLYPNQALVAQTYPENNIRWMKGDFQNYGFLTSQGSYQGLRPIDAWKGQRLISFDLSGGCGVALTEERIAVNQEGAILGQNVAAVSCFGQRYILLMMDGSIVTDRARLQVSNARAVCTDRDGYWIATDKRLLYFKKDAKVPQAYDVRMEEIARDNDGCTIYGFGNNGAMLDLQSIKRS